MTPKLKDLYEIEAELGATRARVKELEEQRETTLAGILSAHNINVSVVGGPVLEESGFILVQKMREIRIPDPGKFLKAFPAVADQLITVRLKDADIALGKNVVDACCTFERRMSYSVVNAGADKE
jgi:hypothetical protein